jgi:hypothetical protein
MTDKFSFLKTCGHQIRQDGESECGTKSPEEARLKLDLSSTLLVQ